MGDMRHSTDEALAGFAKLGSREDADRTHEWARSLADDWQAEKDRLEAQLAGAVEALQEARPYVYNQSVGHGPPDWRRETTQEVLEHVDAAIGGQ